MLILVAMLTIPDFTLHDRGFNDFCVNWNKGMLNVSNMTHTALLGQLINTYHISIQLVKRFGKCVDLMLTSRNAIVKPAFHGACFRRAAFSRATFCSAC